MVTEVTGVQTAATVAHWSPEPRCQGDEHSSLNAWLGSLVRAAAPLGDTDCRFQIQSVMVESFSGQVEWSVLHRDSPAPAGPPMQMF